MRGGLKSREDPESIENRTRISKPIVIFQKSKYIAESVSENVGERQKKKSTMIRRNGKKIVGTLAAIIFNESIEQRV